LTLFPFAKNLRKPSASEVAKYLRRAKGCPKESSFRKLDEKYDELGFVHPSKSTEFADATTLTEKIDLANQWKSLYG
jgi:hypothetical protein